MDIQRIQGYTGALSVESATRLESGSSIKKNVQDIKAELAPSANFKLNATAPKTDILVQDALHDINEDFRNSVVALINHHVDRAKIQEHAKLLSLQLKPLVANIDSIEEFRRIARQFSKGSTAYELAMIDALWSMGGVAETAHFNLTDEFIFFFLKHYELELRAFLNIHKALDAHKGHAEIQELAGAYEEILVKSSSVMQALSALIKRVGVANISAWKPFLIQGAVADLASQHVGADKVHLMFILQELKSLQTLNTFMVMLDEVEERHLSKKKVPNFLQSSFDYIEQPIATMGIIEKWMNACLSSEQILFFQDYRRVFSRISEEAFKSEEQKRNALTVLQKKIDEMVYNDDD